MTMFCSVFRFPIKFTAFPFTLRLSLFPPPPSLMPIYTGETVLKKPLKKGRRLHRYTLERKTLFLRRI